MTPFLGMIGYFGFPYAPKGWALCEGQLLPITQNTALFSLLGTTYGGDGRTTFGLPDLRGRVPIGFGQGPGLSSHTIGEIAGSTMTFLATSQMPTHTHSILAGADAGDVSLPEGAYLANTGNFDKEYKTASTTLKPMRGTMMVNAGGSQPFNRMQPSLVINYCVALQGIYPSRDF